MTTQDIRNKLHEYIDSASDRKVKAFYVIVEDDVENSYDNPLEDPIVLAEMERRYENYKADPGSAKTWEEVKESVKKKNVANKK